MGDLNMRFKSTFSEHISKVLQSSEMIEELDEMHECRFHKAMYPLYEEMPITF